MSETEEPKPAIAKLNEAVDVLSALTSNQIAELLQRINLAKDCDYDCGCNESMCGCRGSVCPNVGSRLSYPEFLAFRETRMAELRRELESLEAPKAAK